MTEGQAHRKIIAGAMAPLFRTPMAASVYADRTSAVACSAA
jgi:hypothetical protein